MGRLLKNLLRWGAYTVFLVVALAFFVYLTLPVDEIKSYLVRKAADEHQMQLDITELKVAGLGGVELRGVTLTPMPTAEEREALAKAHEARKAWREAKKAAEAATAEEADGKSGAAADEETPKKKGKDAKAGEDDGEGDDEANAKGDEDKGDAAKGAKGAKATKRAKAKTPAKKADDEPPPLPPAPVPVFIERLSAKVAPLKLVGGAVDATVDAELMGGHLNIEVAQGSETLTVKGEWEGLSIEQLPFAPKRKKIVIDDNPSPRAKGKPQIDLALIGALEGDVDLEVPLKGKKPELSKITGSLTVRVVNALLGPGQIFSREMGFFDVPRIRMSQVGGGLRFEKRKATFEDFKLTGKDLEGDLQGHIQLADSLKAWGPRAHLRFKFSDEFLKTNKDVNTALKGLPKIRRATDPEGFIGLQVTGSLKDVKTRLTRTSVYRKATPRRSAKKPSAAKTAAKSKRSSRAAKKPKTTARRGSNTARRAPKAATNVAARKPSRPMIAGKTDTDAEDEAEEPDEPEEEPEEDVAEGDEEKPEGEGDGDKAEGEEDGEKVDGDAEGDGEKPEGEGDEEKPDGEGEPE